MIYQKIPRTRDFNSAAVIGASTMAWYCAVLLLQRRIPVKILESQRRAIGQSHWSAA